MVKTKIRSFIICCTVFIFCIHGSGANAGPQALIALHGSSQKTWEQRLTLQETLRERFGFVEIRFLVDVMADEIAPVIKRFLEGNAEKSDSRLVWVSGPDLHKPSSICPRSGVQAIRPSAPSLILAPTCFGKGLILPQGTRHFGITQPKQATLDARLGRIKEKDAPWIAYLNLPSDQPQFVYAADALILRHLSNQSKDFIDAGEILHLLRTKFKVAGSKFTPTLDFFDPGKADASISPFILNPVSSSKIKDASGAKVMSKVNKINIYDRPTLSRPPVFTMIKPLSIHLLRQGTDRRMQYAEMSNNIFGWLRIAELEF